MLVKLNVTIRSGNKIPFVVRTRTTNRDEINHILNSLSTRNTWRAWSIVQCWVDESQFWHD